MGACSEEPFGKTSHGASGQEVSDECKETGRSLRVQGQPAWSTQGVQDSQGYGETMLETTTTTQNKKRQHGYSLTDKSFPPILAGELERRGVVGGREDTAVRTWVSQFTYFYIFFITACVWGGVERWHGPMCGGQRATCAAGFLGVILGAEPARSQPLPLRL